MNETLRILLVDDMKSVVGEINTALLLLSVRNKIDWKCPADPNIPFGCELPHGSELDKYDLALVDLELFPTKSSLYYEPDDLRGGTEVLPYLREEAPWLPVLAESRLYLKEAEHFLAVAGSFGFDGHIPRDIFRKGMIDKKLWDLLINTAGDLRLKAVIGDKVWKNRQDPEIEVAHETESILSGRTTHWRELIQKVFCFNRKVVVHKLPGGFSGAQVFKVYARPPFEHGGSEGEWLLKISNSPSKLHQEAQAHLSMLRSGLDFARMVPLLWNDVIVHRRTGAIAYQFASNTREASEFLDTTSNVMKACEHMASIFARFYRNTRTERSIIGNLFSEWGPSPETLVKLLSLLPNSPAKTLLKQAASKHESALLSEDVEYRRCLIHGDLHLSNIMIGDSNVLIDFARSKDGPIAVDAAKLLSDFFLRLPQLQLAELPSWDTRTGLTGEILGCLDLSFNLNQGDKKLFSLFLISNLTLALQYGDVGKETKAWIRTVVSSTTL
jgi:hypothetical protein